MSFPRNVEALHGKYRIGKNVKLQKDDFVQFHLCAQEPESKLSHFFLTVDPLKFPVATNE